MITIIVIAIYILGMWVAYNKILEWNKESIKSRNDYQELFMVSLFSWLAFIVLLTDKSKEE